ncbi:acyl-CoA oxidase [Coprinopsis cinerea okayama7|uniref:Acyl-coenzyme A oxidase n=1 Tax=Coprinopsis cinerea (strain Okayama-7 / 130 / ATCC MYA-4618 / FGSC 9003) TaxID=240176 RepID=D6RQ74_COPC7|nr:acyl-CoA oxidase [Coprinopsis cinerea okayama7\|eukprot:XP_002910341.1 acyl-CoA oxidase [Coprinopsis cinerea okayama7\
MAKPYDVNEQTGKDMTAARAATTIAVEEVRNYLYNGAEEFQTRHNIVEVLQNDPVFDKSQRDFMSRTERYTRGMALTNRIYELQEKLGWNQQQTSTATAILDEQLPIALHNIAFQPVFNLQGSPELVKKYGRLIATRGIFGCYLQTELGHGTNVSRLETTATYIPETREFEINSPTVTSSKWWIGALGKTATHGVVQAKLIIEGKDYGPHLFFVQLRSMEDHKPLPGIIIGDIGPKSGGGFAPTDNGFARFDHVRIPKEHMLSKFAQVTDDGKYIQPPHAKLSYGGMLYIRANMVTGGGWLMAKAATVAIRYGTVRRQGAVGPDGLEQAVISYPSTYYRLLPILSHAYVFIQLGKQLTKAFDTMAGRLAKGDTSLLAEMHATTSGLKVLVSSTGVQDIEVARRSMGGHGYSAFSGLGRIYNDYLPSVTYEGDNFALDQQVVRAALKSLKGLSSSTNLSPSSYYLRLLIPPVSVPNFKLTPDQWLDPANPVLLLEWRAALVVQEMARNLKEPDASVNQRVSKAVTEAFVARQVGDMINEAQTKLGNKRQKEALVLGQVFLLYLLTTLEAGITDVLSFGLLSSTTGSDATRSLRLAIQRVCQALLPEAIGLTDAFGFTDWELDSALGVYDGKVYEALWKRAQQEPLNQMEVPEAYEKSIKPILQRGQRQAGVKVDRAKL